MRKASGYTEQEIPHSRKLHAALCNIPTFLKYFGTIDKADTSSWESVHRSMTVGIWELTSKRHDSMISEMINQCLYLNYSSTNDLITAVTSSKLKEYVAKKGPNIPPDYVVIEPITNMPLYSLSIDENDILTCHNLNNILLGSSLNDVELTKLVKKYFGITIWESIKSTERPISFSIIQGVYIEGTTTI